MLLRRVIEHVKTQNWTAVALDFVIVVVGVFMGIQVSNWNEARQRLDQEQEVLASILEDIKNDRTELSSGLDMAHLNIDATNYAFAAAGLPMLETLTMPINDIPALSGFEFNIPPPRALTDEQKARLWSISIVRFYPTQADSAFDTLVAAGDLSIIDNAELIRELQRYNQMWAALENSQVRSYRPFRDQALYTGQEFGLSPFSNMSEADYIALLRSEPKLSSTLRTILEYGVIHHRQMERADKEAIDLIEILETEIR